LLCRTTSADVVGENLPISLGFTYDDSASNLNFSELTSWGALDNLLTGPVIADDGEAIADVFADLRLFTSSISGSELESSANTFPPPGLYFCPLSLISWYSSATAGRLSKKPGGVQLAYCYKCCPLTPTA